MLFVPMAEAAIDSEIDRDADSVIDSATDSESDSAIDSKTDLQVDSETDSEIDCGIDSWIECEIDSEGRGMHAQSPRLLTCGSANRQSLVGLCGS